MLIIRKLSTKAKAVLLLVAGLIIGAWHSYGIATGSKPASHQPGLVLETIILLTFVWMLIWTLARRANEDQDG